VHLAPGDLEQALREDVRRGLTSSPKDLPPKWFYDHRGSVLFDEITRLPEYYPTRTERTILEERAAAVAAFGADTLIELGSGTSEKTRLLLDAMGAEGTLRRYCPFDVSEAFLREAAAELARQEPWLEVHAVVGDFEHHLGRIPGPSGRERGAGPSGREREAGPSGREPGAGKRLVAFLGSTIGNLDPDARARFFTDLGAALAPGDGLLLGTDLVKDTGRLIAAYDDAAGVTAEFNRNVLHVINRELGADFDVDCFRHVARWDTEHEWIEMRLQAQGEQHVRVDGLDLEVQFADGEQMRTEISSKFREAGVRGELEAAGFGLASWWTDPAGDFAVSLSVRR
jgi:L-histidine N-alpha-methyltransferase